MGLDMYLCVRSNPEVNPDDYDCEVAYWRKANEIHGWFKDYCEPVPGVEESWWVTREDISNLIETCGDVIDHCVMLNIGEDSDSCLFREGSENYAAEHLPTCPGFFFGSTDYDEWYASSVVSTIGKLKNVLDNYDDEIFRYDASW